MASETAFQPILVESWRGDAVENRYRGQACVINSEGDVIHAWGDIDVPVYPRSALKPIQAIPFIETGAADAFGVSESEIAIAAASHSGEAIHRETVAGLLAKIGLGPQHLECGTHQPMSALVAKDLVADRCEPTVLHHNCGGQHASFLAVAEHLGAPQSHYIKHHHPVQELVADAVSGLCYINVAAEPLGTDGCGIPTYALPLRALAFGMARFGDPESMADRRKTACLRIFQAMTSEPYLVAGLGRFDTVAMQASMGRFLVKTGADGVYAAVLPDQRLGIALKIESGNREASETAIAAILKFLNVLDKVTLEAVKPFLHRPVIAATGETVGYLKPAAGFPA